MADIPTILEIERSAATAPHWSVAQYEAILAAGIGERCLFVAEGPGGIAGFAVGAIAAGEGELESVVVRLDRQRQGIGRELCMAVIGWVLEAGVGGLLLEVRAGSGGAIHLYQCLGFLRVGLRRGYYSGPPDDAVLMRLTLIALRH